MTARQFAEMAASAGLENIEQFDGWQHNRLRYGVAGTGDTITILGNP